MQPHTVAMVVVEDSAIHPYDLYEYGIVCSIFGVAHTDLADPWYRFRICAATPGNRGSWPGFRLDPTHGLDAAVTADTVIVPSVPQACVDGDEPVPESLLEALRQAHSRGARLVSLCAGAYALAAAGLLDGRRATVNRDHATDLVRRHREVEIDQSVLYVDDSDVLTSAGMSAGLDLCLHLVRRDRGATVANQLARRMAVPAHRPGGQSQFVELPVPETDDDSLTPVMQWATTRLHRPLRVAELAAHARMSERTFHRRLLAATGSTPLRWLLHQRLIKAQSLLESTALPVERISRDCGLGSASNLRRHFTSAFGVSPTDYRKSFMDSTTGAPVR